MSIGRQPPHNIEAEEYLLSCALIDGAETISIASSRGVTALTFYSPANRTIWARLLQMLSSGKPIDLSTLSQDLIESCEFSAVGGWPYLMQISGRIPTTAQADFFAEKLVELASLREIIKIGSSLVEDCYGYSGGGVASATSSRVTELLKAVSGADPKPERTWDQLIEEAGVIADSIIKNNGRPADKVINWPWREMDELFQPMERGQLIVIAARPSVGKSSLARPMAVSAAFAGHPAYFVTLEVNPEKVPLQLAATASGIGINSLGRSSAGDQSSFKAALIKLRGIGLTVSRRDKSLGHIVSRAKAMHARKPLGIIFIDHGGQVEDVYQAKPNDKQAVISRMTKTLKGLAGELNCVVVLLWQLNRASAKEGNREPQSHDMRDCGSLEEDADKVILIHRPGENPLTGETQADNDLVRDRPSFFQNVIQAKGRDDGGSIVSFSFKRETATFTPIKR